MQDTSFPKERVVTLIPGASREQSVRSRLGSVHVLLGDLESWAAG